MDGARAREQRPCDNCRRRKIRCLFSSDEATSCVLCVSRSIECTYLHSAPRKKRVLSTEDDKTRSGGGGRPKQRARLQAFNGDETVRDYANLSGKSLLKETLGHQNRQSSSVIGATSDFDSSLTRPLLWNAKGECATFSPPQILRRANRTVHFMMRPDPQDEVDAELADLDAIENFVGPHGPELVNLYFRIVHPSFPVLHKKVFLEKYGRSYRELTPTGLGAVYIMALNWWSYSPALSSLPKPDAKELESLVLGMLFETHRRPKISNLQGGLVLMQSPNVSSWALAGYLVSMAQNLGINMDCSDWQVPDWERGVRKRVAWALFLQDKWGALVYGRASLIRPEEWDVRPLDSSDFPETAKDDDVEEGSAEIEKGKQTFLQMVTLSEIVAEILDRFFTLKALRRQDSTQEVLERAKPLQLKLRAWHANLPPVLSVEETVPRKLSSVGYLHLAYYTAEITLHRVILRTHRLRVTAALNPPVDLRVITRRAAGTRFTTALDFVKRLKAEHLQSFWYFSSSLSLAIIGLFAGILCATSYDSAGELEEREAYMSKLAEYRWILRINATSADFMKYAVSVLDARSQLLEQQPQRREEPQPGETNAAVGWSRGASQPQLESLQGSRSGEDDEDTSDYISPGIEDFFSSLREDGGEAWQQPPAFEQHQFDLGLASLSDYHQDSTL